MKKALILFLLFIPLFLEAQVRVFPADTVTKVNNGTGGGPLGRTGGVTFTFSMHTGVYDSCAYWGFVSGVNGDIKMAMNNLVAPPTPNCTYTGSEYFVLTGGLGTNSLTFSGSTNVYCQNTANNFSNTSVTTRAFVTVSAGTFIQVDSFLLVKVAGQNSFDVTVRYETYGPTGRNYFVNYANTWTPSVTLFDALHTDDNRSICTSFESDIYAYSEIKADTIIGAPDTVCSGNASGVLTASATGGSGTYSYQWYSNGAMVVGAVNSAYNTPTITANTDYFCVIYDSCSAFSGFVRADTTDTVTIVVSGVAAVGGTAASDQVLCPENTPNTLLATGYSNGTITKWQIATDNLFSVPIDIANITDSLTGLQIEAAAGGPLLQSYFARMEIDNPACPASYSSTVSITINDPSNLTFVDDTGTCYVNGNSGWQHFYHPQRRNIIASINSNSQDIGITEVIVFQHAGNSIRVNTPTRCLTWHAVMNRSFVIHSADTFSNPVNVRLYFTDAELAELIDTSLITQNTGGATTWPTNDPPGCTDNDDVRSINDVLVTQISNAVAENGAFDIHDGDFLLHTPANSGIGNATFGANYVEIQVNNFSEFWLHGSQTNIPLPVDLFQFEVELEEPKKAVLNWKTALEINNDKFEIYRKLDSELEFTKIGEVPGSGNTNSVQSYTFEDNLNGINENLVYYQLKQIDFDGDYETSKIKYVSLYDQIKSITVFPNPAKTKIQVLTANHSDGFNYSIVNSVGQLVLAGVLENGQFIDVSSLSMGAYYLKIGSVNEKEEITSFIIQ